MLEAPEKASDLLRPVLEPGGSLVNYLPFCAASGFIPVMLVVPNSIFFSATYSFVGTMRQLQTTGANS
jgi:hypothetical protein